MSLCASSSGLLKTGEPPAFEVINPDAQTPLLLLCDHASNRIPLALNELGLTGEDRARHIAYDIGIAEVTRLLARALDCPAVFCQYSRLVVDCNRAPNDTTAMPSVSDGTIVQGNRALTPEQQEERRQAIFYPYHHAIDETLSALRGRLGGKVPLILAMHSFTPCLKDGGCNRPWHIGLLWNQDGRLFDALCPPLREQGWCVGDNLPYSGREIAYTLNRHAEPDGLAHVGLEIRQDLISTPDGIAVWAQALEHALRPLLSQDTLLRPVLPSELVTLPTA